MRSALLLILLLSIANCSQGALNPGLSDLDNATPTPVSVECDTCRYPIVMVHGFLASGDTWAKFQQLFHSNGYPSKLIHAFDWNSLNQFGGNTPQQLDQFIDQVLALTGETKVRLIGHLPPANEPFITSAKASPT